MKAFYCDQFVLPLPSGHRFPMQKYRMLRDQIDIFLPQIELCEAMAATDGELALVHSPTYIQDVLEGQLSSQAQREIGFPWSKEMVERSKRSVGATLAACRVAMREGIAGNLAGGTHHAYRDKGSGFCVFNDAAVAARVLQMEWARTQTALVKQFQVAIIDLDVHQGNGSAAIFQDDASVFTLSLHGESNFPFRKERGDLDVGLPKGSGDDLYLQALEQALFKLEQQFQANFVIYLAGADPLQTDRLGQLSLTPAGLKTRDQMVFEWAYKRHLPLAFCMVGGYSTDIQDTVLAQRNTFEQAFFYWQDWQNRPRS